MASKFLIQMSGAPGSGKTTLSQLLVKHPSLAQCNLVALDHDLLKTFFLESDHDFNVSGKLAYRMQWMLAESLIQQGKSVIVDCPCNFSHILDSGMELAKKYRYEYRYLECQVGVKDIGLLDERLKLRQAMRSMRTGVCDPPKDSVAITGSVKTQEEHRVLFTKWIESPFRPEIRRDSGVYMVVDSSVNNPQQCAEEVVMQLLIPAKVL